MNSSSLFILHLHHFLYTSSARCFGSSCSSSFRQLRLPLRTSHPPFVSRRFILVDVCGNVSLRHREPNTWNKSFVRPRSLPRESAQERGNKNERSRSDDANDSATREFKRTGEASKKKPRAHVYPFMGERASRGISRVYSSQHRNIHFRSPGLVETS